MNQLIASVSIRASTSDAEQDGHVSFARLGVVCVRKRAMYATAQGSAWTLVIPEMRYQMEFKQMHSCSQAKFQE